MAGWQAGRLAVCLATRAVVAVGVGGCLGVVSSRFVSFRLVCGTIGCFGFMLRFIYRFHVSFRFVFLRVSFLFAWHFFRGRWVMCAVGVAGK